MRRKGLGKSKGQGYKNILGNDSGIHSMSSKGIKQPMRMNESRLDSIDKQMNINLIPYTNDVKFYANPNTKKIIVVETKDLGKGWYQHKVGDEIIKTRQSGKVNELLNEFYPNYKEISLFTETSYHSGLNEAGKITSYGTEDYTLEFSDYSPLEKYDLEQQVRTTNKKDFGKVINKVNLQKWNNIVLDWIPKGDKMKFQFRQTTSTPFGDKKTIFESKIYKESEKKQAINDFKKYVKKYKTRGL